MHRIVLLLLACLLASPSALAEPAVKVMVLPLKPGPGVSRNSAEVLTGAFVTALQALPGLQVLTMKDVDDLLGFERKKAAVNVEVSRRLGEDVCTGDSSCLAEIGGALGTQFIVTGSVDRLGSLTALTVQVLDSRKATVVERHQERVKGGEEVLIESMDTAAQALFPGRGGGAAQPVAATGGLSFGGGVQVKKPTVKIAAATGGTFKDINLQVEQLLDAALEKQDDPRARAEEKAGAWCALAAVSDRNPYEQQASQACDEWRKYAEDSRRLEEQLEGDYTTLAGFLGLKRKSKQDKLTAVDAFLASYASIAEHEKVRAVKAARRDVSLGREVTLAVEPEAPPAAAATPTSGDVKKRAFGPCPDQVSCLMQNECKKGKAVSCNNLAGLYMQGQSVPKDIGRALALWEVACNGGNLASCGTLGAQYLYVEEVKSPERALPFLQRACEGRNPQGCASLGAMYMQGTGVTKDIKRAFDYMVLGCDHDESGVQCLGPAAWLINGFETVAKDVDRAEAMYRKACNAKQKGGCDMLKLLEDQKRQQQELDAHTERQLATLSRDFEEAERACQRNDVCKYQLQSCRDDRKQCHALASAYTYGHFDQAKNDAIAAEWNRRSCEAGSEHGCHNYAAAMREGKGVKRDEKAAVARFRQLCERSGGDPTMIALSCWSMDHHGGESEKALAKKRYGELCDQKNETACIYAGRKK